MVFFTGLPRTHVQFLLPEDYHATAVLKKPLKNSGYHITVNHCFEDVIAACATDFSAEGQAGTWITDRFSGSLHTITSFRTRTQHRMLAA